jgi:predicted ATP-dependent endonuclease of OLD family
MSKAWLDVPALRSWKLHNFKSVADAELDLAPLTLVVGANSAGKSSLLQSILMMAQASAETTPGGFPLNGLLVGLGEFTEARSDFEARVGEDISIGGELALPYPISRRRMFAEPEFELEESRDDADKSERAINVVKWDVNLEQDPESKGSALVHDSRVTLFRGSTLLGELSSFVRSGDDLAPEVVPRWKEEFGDR